MGLLRALLQISGPSHYWLIDYLLPDNLTGVKSIDILDAENCLTFEEVATSCFGVSMPLYICLLACIFIRIWEENRLVVFLSATQLSHRPKISLVFFSSVRSILGI